MREVPSRPYQYVDGSPPSATTALGLIAKKGMDHAAARATSWFAYNCPEEWAHMAERDAINRMSHHFVGTWDSRAAMGSLVHKLMEFYAAAPADIPDLDRLIRWFMDNDPKASDWRNQNYEKLVSEVQGYANALDDWWAQYQPALCQSEVVVRLPGFYIGTTDLRCLIDGEDWLVDLKTGKPKNGKPPRPYGRSWTYQLAMYGMATETVHYEVEETPDDTWGDGDRERGWRVVETGTGPWSPPERYGVIHLIGDGYRFYPVDVSQRVCDDVLSFVRFYHGHESRSDSLGRPLKPRELRKGVA